jgi:LmbE family N-acetylglucosaminyl deacetylase
VLARLLDDRQPVPRVLLLVAHPDDESVGAGARLQRLCGATFLHVTDGAPRDLADARAAGCRTREEYARARRAELQAALGLAGIAPRQARTLAVVDQEASLHLSDLVRAVAEWVCAVRPEVVLTHPYEGGHPDHDGVAFAASAGCQLLRQQGESLPAVIEMASYYRGRAGLTTETFVDGGDEVRTLELSEAERAFKRRLFDCYRSQRRVLEAFPLRVERLRPAPDYDFTRPPHEGELWYERFNWGWTGQRWRRLVQEALQDLGEPGLLRLGGPA